MHWTTLIFNQEKIMTLALFKVPNTNNFVTLEVILRSLRGQSAIFWRDQSCSLDKLWSTTKNRYLAQFQVPNTSRGQLQVLEVILRSFEGCFEVKVFFLQAQSSWMDKSFEGRLEVKVQIFLQAQSSWMDKLPNKKS